MRALVAGLLLLATATWADDHPDPIGGYPPPAPPPQIVVVPMPFAVPQRPLVVLPGTSSMPIMPGSIPGTYYQPGPGGPTFFNVQRLP